jgi:transcriptional regulator with XRE-family HTH domain
MNADSKTWQKLRNKRYRDAFVAAQLKTGIPFQIGAMRKKLGWSQEKLAAMAGVTQGVISRAENPNYGNLTFNTVLRIAAGFDAAFVGWFVPFSQLTERFENLTEESVQVPTFSEEDKTESVPVPKEESEPLATGALSQSAELQQPTPFPYEVRPSTGTLSVLSDSPLSLVLGTDLNKSKVAKLGPNEPDGIRRILRSTTQSSFTSHADY